MSSHTSTPIVGKFVRIEPDRRLFVLVKRGGFIRRATRKWLEVPPSTIGLNAYNPWFIDTAYGKYTLDGLGLNQRQLSHLLGVPMLDQARAKVIWQSPRAVGGSRLRVMFDDRELTYVSRATDPDPAIVCPFSYFSHVMVAGEPQLVDRFASDNSKCLYRLGDDFPLSPHDLARRMGLDVVSAAGAEAAGGPAAG